MSAAILLSHWSKQLWSWWRQHLRLTFALLIIIVKVAIGRTYLNSLHPRSPLPLVSFFWERGSNFHPSSWVTSLWLLLKLSPRMKQLIHDIEASLPFGQRWFKDHLIFHLLIKIVRAGPSVLPLELQTDLSSIGTNCQVNAGGGPVLILMMTWQLNVFHGLMRSICVHQIHLDLLATMALAIAWSPWNRREWEPSVISLLVLAPSVKSRLRLLIIRRVLMMIMIFLLLIVAIVAVVKYHCIFRRMLLSCMLCIASSFFLFFLDENFLLLWWLSFISTPFCSWFLLWLATWTTVALVTGRV